MIITLLSDFGLRDSYVTEMKGTILTICSDATIIDITHNVKKFNIKMGAFILASAAPHFPEGTIHVAVVDPGVGTKRRPIIVEAKNRIYVGPDNGLLILSAKNEGLKRVIHVTNKQFFHEKVSKTFHGRDVFAPVAAYLAKGVKSSKFGQEIIDFIKPTFVEPTINREKIRGEILHIDDFGNLITNISQTILDKTKALKRKQLQISIAKKSKILRFSGTYGDVSEGTALILIGSHGFLEIAVSLGSAKKVFNAKLGDAVNVHLS